MVQPRHVRGPLLGNPGAHRANEKDRVLGYGHGERREECAAVVRGARLEAEMERGAGHAGSGTTAAAAAGESAASEASRIALLEAERAGASSRTAQLEARLAVAEERVQADAVQPRPSIGTLMPPIIPSYYRNNIYLSIQSISHIC